MDELEELKAQVKEWEEMYDEQKNRVEELEAYIDNALHELNKR